MILELITTSSRALFDVLTHEDQAIYILTLAGIYSLAVGVISLFRR